jgi:hypothetical protein
MESYKWKDNKGTVVEVHTMSNRWLKNIKKYLTGKLTPHDDPALLAIRNELKRRKL